VQGVRGIGARIALVAIEIAHLHRGRCRCGAASGGDDRERDFFARDRRGPQIGERRLFSGAIGLPLSTAVAEILYPRASPPRNTFAQAGFA